MGRVVGDTGQLRDWAVMTGEVAGVCLCGLIGGVLRAWVSPELLASGAEGSGNHRGSDSPGGPAGGLIGELDIDFLLCLSGVLRRWGYEVVRIGKSISIVGRRELQR